MAAPKRLTVRFMLFLLLFLIVLFLLFLIFVIPGIKEYKRVRAQNQIIGIRNHTLEQKIKKSMQELNQLERNESMVLSKFHDDFNKTAFLHFAGRYFTRVSLTPQKEQNGTNPLKEYRFKASVNTSTPVKFYDFIEGLKRYPGICKINFPIVMEEHAGTLSIDFQMSIYKIH